MVIKSSFFYYILCLMFLLQCSCHARLFGSSVLSFRKKPSLDYQGDEKLKWNMNLGLNAIRKENSGSEENGQSSTQLKSSRTWRGVNYKKRNLRSLVVNNDGFMETDYQPPHRKSPIHNK